MEVPVCERLIKARNGESKKKVAEACGISLSALSMYELGQRIPRDTVKKRLAQYYGKSIQELFF